MNMRIKIFQTLETILEKLGEWIETLRQRVAVCSDCGRNRYTGQPCIKF
jgi:hypothetical protein